VPLRGVRHACFDARLQRHIFRAFMRDVFSLRDTPARAADAAARLLRYARAYMMLRHMLRACHEVEPAIYATPLRLLMMSASLLMFTVCAIATLLPPLLPPSLMLR